MGIQQSDLDRNDSAILAPPLEDPQVSPRCRIGRRVPPLACAAGSFLPFKG